jgi:regulator of replication initiation timing
MKTVKPRATVSMKLAVALAKQAAFNNKVAELKRAVTSAAEADIRGLQLKIGKLAEEFGILNLPDAVLRKAFADISKLNGAKPQPAPSVTEVKAVATPEPVNPFEPVIAGAPVPTPTVETVKAVEEKKGGLFGR